jgi:hypothetical protein
MTRRVVSGSEASNWPVQAPPRSKGPYQASKDGSTNVCFSGVVSKSTKPTAVNNDFSKSLIAEREKASDGICQAWLMARYDNVDPKVIRPLRRHFDRDRNPTVWPQPAMEACETPRRVRENMRPSLQSTASKLTSGKVRACQSSTATPAFGNPARRCRALSAISEEMSVASAEPREPTMSMAAWAEMPVPVVTSSTRWPGASLRARSGKGRKSAET